MSVYPRRFLAFQLALAFLAGAGIAAAATLSLVEPPPEPHWNRCGSEAPPGPAIQAALEAAMLWVRDGALRDDEDCAYLVAGSELRDGYSRARWATSRELPIVPLVTRYKATALSSSRIELIPYGKQKKLVGRGEHGEPEVTFKVMLAAPDSPASGWQLVLAFREGRWQVSYWAALGGMPAPVG